MLPEAMDELLTRFAVMEVGSSVIPWMKDVDEGRVDCRYDTLQRLEREAACTTTAVAAMARPLGQSD